jgi:hypothetical protein
MLPLCLKLRGQAVASQQPRASLILHALVDVAGYNKTRSQESGRYVRCKIKLPKGGAAILLRSLPSRTQKQYTGKHLLLNRIQKS